MTTCSQRAICNVGESLLPCQLKLYCTNGGQVSQRASHSYYKLLIRSRTKYYCLVISYITYFGYSQIQKYFQHNNEPKQLSSLVSVSDRNSKAFWTCALLTPSQHKLVLKVLPSFNSNWNNRKQTKAFLKSFCAFI